MAKSKVEIICPNVDKQKVEETRQLAEKIATLPMQTKLVFAAAAEMAAIIHDASASSHVIALRKNRVSLLRCKM